MSWPRVKLREIFTIARGGSPRPIDAFITNDPSGVNWIMIGDANEGSKYIDCTKKKIRPEGEKKSRRVNDGDFLLTNSMSFGRPYILRTNGCIHDGWLVLSPADNQVFPDFFYYLLGSDDLRREFKKRASGAVVKNLNTKLVESVEVPLPPLPEQKRIAAILDAADALRAKRRESIKQLDALIQSTFIDMFGDPVTNPMGWDVRPLEQLIDPKRPITYGILKPGPDLDDGVPYVRVVDIKARKVLVEQLRRTSSDIAQQYKRSTLKSEDILMSIRGHVGRMALAPKSIEGANITQDTARLSVTAAMPGYVMQCLSSAGMQHYMARRTKGVAVRGINLGDVKKLPIPVPPAARQAKFSALLDAVERQLDLMSDQLDQYSALFASLQSRAFAGEL